MLHDNFLIWFLIYAFGMMVVGWYVTRHQKTGDDFILGGRKLPMLLTLGSTVGTMVGTGSSIGAVSKPGSSGDCHISHTEKPTFPSGSVENDHRRA